MKKLLLIDVSHVSVQSTGSARVCFELVPEILGNLNFNLWNVIIIENDVDLKLKIKNCVSDKVVFYSKQFYKLVDSIDVIFIPVPKNGVLDSWRIFKSNAFLITQYLDFIAFKNKSYFINSINWFRYVAVSYFYFLNSNVIIVNSKYVINEFSEIFFSKRIGPKLIEIPLGVANSTQMFESEKVMESKIILVVGTSYVHKNRIWAIKLMEKLLKIDDRYLVIFCGPDPRYGHTRLEDDIYVQQNLSFLSNNLIFPGWVNDELYNYFVENSDLVLYPSIEEGFGLVPFEITTKNRACLFGRVGIFKNSEFVNSNIRFLSLENLNQDFNLVVEFLTSYEARRQQIANITLCSKSYSFKNYSDKFQELLMKL